MDYMFLFVFESFNILQSSSIVFLSITKISLGSAVSKGVLKHNYIRQKINIYSLKIFILKQSYSKTNIQESK